MKQADTFLRSVRIILRSERIIAEAQAQIIGRKLILAVVAAIAALFALGLLNATVYLVLEGLIGAVGAASTLALANLFITIVFVLIARSIETGPEVDMVRDFRDMAVSDIESQVKDVEHDIRRIGSGVTDLGGAVFNLVGGPGNLVKPGLAIAAISAIAKSIKSNSKK
jgi:hypothetical protein